MATRPQSHPLQSPSHSASSTDNPRCRAGSDSPWARVDSWWRDCGRTPSAGCEPVSRACRQLWLRRSMGVWCDASRAEIVVQTPAFGDVCVDDVALLGVVWATARVAPAIGKCRRARGPLTRFDGGSASSEARRRLAVCGHVSRRSMAGYEPGLAAPTGRPMPSSRIALPAAAGVANTCTESRRLAIPAATTRAI